jgi:hypothetical protein
MCHPGVQPLSCGRQAAGLSGGHPPSCHYGATGRPPPQKSQQAGGLFAGQAGRPTGLSPMGDLLPGSFASMVEHIKVVS